MRIGIFVCHCGFNIGGVIDVPAVLAHFSDTTTYPDVSSVDHEYLCSDAGLIHLKKMITENQLDRVVIAACTLKLHGELFRKACEDAGINRFLVEFANIREQNAWVHAREPRQATQKAIDQIDMALAKVRLASPLVMDTSPVTQATLVIGGGVAGIKAALAVADAGFKTYLVEREPSIGGHMALFDKTFPTLDCSICVLGPEMVHVKEHPNIVLLTYSDVEEVSGHVGNFSVRVRKKARHVDESKCVGCFDDCCGPCPVSIDDAFFPRKAIYVPFPQAVPLIPVIDEDACIHCKACELGCKREAIKYEQVDELLTIEVGAIIAATGYEPFDSALKPEFSYGTNPNVISGLEMERLLNPDGPTKGKLVCPGTGLPPKSIAFVLCVGARDDKVGNPWCARACCNFSVKQAVQAADRLEGASITIYYTDLRATGKGCEEFLNRSRSAYGIRYTRGRVSRIRPADVGNTLIVEAEDTLVQRLVEQEVDLVVLATAMVPPRDEAAMAKVLNISLGSDGYFLEDHLKMRPSQSTVRGIYLAGVAQGPKDIPESIASAESAASKAIALMAKGIIDLDPRKVQYDQDKCTKCKLCTEVCNFNALAFHGDRVVISVPDCTGCGACQAACPSGALSIPGFTRDEVLVQLDAILDQKSASPLIVAFLCNWCSYAGADLAGTAKLQYPAGVRTIHVMCSSMVDPLYIFTAFAKGADGVLVAGCHEQDCHYNTGFMKTRAREESIRQILERMHVDQDRFRVASISAGEGARYQEIITTFIDWLKRNPRTQN
jgi:heterodisulfide reductase subunit A